MICKQTFQVFTVLLKAPSLVHVISTTSDAQCFVKVREALRLFTMVQL